MNRVRFSIVTLALVSSALVSSAPVPSQQPDIPRPQNNEPKKIHGEGCVEAGVEAKCLIVRDVKSGKLYNILVGEPRPALGEGIEFTVTLHQGAAVCMQGATIEVERWAHKESIKCRHTPAPRK